MKFSIKVRDVGAEEHKAWDEPYDKPEVTDQATADAWGKDTIAFFNSGLHSYEKAREWISTTLVDGSEGSVKDHDWTKTNLTTIAGRGEGMSYDTQKCVRCGVTGKRYGLSGSVAFDGIYRKAKVYQRCDTALAHIEKNGRPGRER